MAHDDVVIWHNPKCTKSREALTLIHQKGIEPNIVRYLETPPTAAEIERMLKALSMEPRELMRRKETLYKELGLEDPKKSRKDLVRAMAENPLLIERPVVLRNGRAVLARPADKLLALLE